MDSLMKVTVTNSEGISVVLFFITKFIFSGYDVYSSHGSPTRFSEDMQAKNYKKEIINYCIENHIHPIHKVLIYLV